MGNAVSYCEEQQQQDSREDSGDDLPTMSGEHVASRGEEKVPKFTKGDGAAEQEGDSEQEDSGAADTGEGDSDDSEEEEAEEPRVQIEVSSTPYDSRFPGFNQARACYTRYNEFYKCKANKDETDPECRFYQKAYRSICPGEWVESWNEQREAGNWFGKY